MPGSPARFPTRGWCPGHASLFTMSIIRRTLSHRGSCQGPRSSSYPDRLTKEPLDTSRRDGGARRDRTDDLMLAKHALSQLSYGPTFGLTPKTVSMPGASDTPTDPKGPQGRPAARADARDSLRRRTSPPALEATTIVVGLGRLERPTSPLSGVRSNHLSYRPDKTAIPDRQGPGSRRSADIRMIEKEKRRRRVPPIGPYD